MPDILKEMQEAVAAGVLRLIDKQQRQRAIQAGGPARTLGGGQDLLAPLSVNAQNFFTTGYDSVNKVTTVPFLSGFSVVDGDDVVTM